MSRPKQKTQVIKQIRKHLKEVKCSEVAALLGCGTANIYFHLGRGEQASISHLNRIFNAIEEVKSAQQKALESLSKKVA